jgi:hypothetical protein
MNVPLWAAELAAAFWRNAGEAEPFPRNLRRPIARAVPLSVVLLPKLTVAAALEWLRNCGTVCEFAGADRPLRACLVARNGHGVALIDGSDGEADQRFSVAHELAHFLRDYWDRRQHIRKQLGVAALEVVDGRRPPSPDERMHSLLRPVQFGFHVHLMERDNDGNPAAASIAQAEEDADRLAYELLAPAEHVSASSPGSRQDLVNRLRDTYGLPTPQAVRYAATLLPSAPTDPLLRRLKLLA